MSPEVNRVVTTLRAHGLTGEVRAMAEKVPTAAAAAEKLGCPTGAIANSLVFTADGEPLLVLASGAHRVDTGKVAALVGVRKVRRAEPDLVLAATGQRVGGVAPTGHPRPLRTVVDTALAGYAEVWAGGGDEWTMFRTTFGELVALTGGTAAEIARD